MSQAALTCFSSTGSIVESVQWLVNSTHLEESNNSINLEIHDVGGVETLSIPNITVEFNTTTIQCVATFDMGFSSDHSDITTILVQGWSVDY